LNFSPTPTAEIIEYDIMGRKIKETEGDCAGMDVDAVNVLPKNKSTTTYSYVGDSILIVTDSVMINGRLGFSIRSVECIRWEKTPPPTPRPILWQDSIESNYSKIVTHYSYVYPNASSIVYTKIDSSVSTTHVFYTIQNKKLIGKGVEEEREHDTIITNYWTRIYTLNEKYDTISYNIYSKRNPTSHHDDTYGGRNNNFDYKCLATMETERTGENYAILYTNHYGDDGQWEPNPTAEKIISPDPWNDSETFEYYTDVFLYIEDRSLANEKSNRVHERVELLKY